MYSKVRDVDSRVPPRGTGAINFDRIDPTWEDQSSIAPKRAFPLWDAPSAHYQLASPVLSDWPSVTDEGRMIGCGRYPSAQFRDLAVVI